MLRLQNTYEESLINVANKKGGLNEAILGNLASSNSEDPHENAAMISRLLKEGAHSLLGGKCASPLAVLNPAFHFIYAPPGAQLLGYCLKRCLIRKQRSLAPEEANLLCLGVVEYVCFV